MRLMLTAATCLALAGVSQAEGLKIQPGQWENTSTFNVEIVANGETMSLPPQTEMDQDCVTEEDATFDPKDLAQEGCTASDINTNGTSMSFKVNCDNNGVVMTGEVDVETSNDGNEVNGTISLSGEQPGMGTFAMAGTISGKRVGVCPAAQPAP